MTAGYSGTSLVKKLGIKPGSSLLLVRAPDGFEKELVGLPDVRPRRIAAPLRHKGSDRPDITVWFVTRRAELEAGIAAAVDATGAGLWIAWPKKASGVKSDVTENVVRDAGLAHGVVDYKVCAINALWSGLKFARRRATAQTRRDRPASS
jgi:hypothetical protein